MMGDGIIELQKIRGWVEAAGLFRLCRGRDLLRPLWSLPADDVLDTCMERYQSVV